MRPFSAVRYISRLLIVQLHVAHLLPIHPYEQFALFIQPPAALLSLGDNGHGPSLAIHSLLLHKSSIETRPLRSLLTSYAFPYLPVPPDSSLLLFDRDTKKKTTAKTSACQIHLQKKKLAICRSEATIAVSSRHSL